MWLFIMIMLSIYKNACVATLIEQKEGDDRHVKKKYAGSRKNACVATLIYMVVQKN